MEKNLMEFIYKPDYAEIIIEHEKEMLQTYSEIIGGYRKLFEQFGCSMVVGCGWINNAKKKYDIFARLPFESGYECFIYFRCERNGKEIHIKSSDGEADFYPISTSWIISVIHSCFFKLKVSLCSAVDDIGEEMDRLLRLLSSEQ